MARQLKLFHLFREKGLNNMNQVMSQLSRLTLVTPTYNRQRFALRSMQFWSGKGAHLIMLDGSSQPISQECLVGLGDNIQYVWMPVSLEERLRKATQMVDTEYVVMLADDEFFLPSALEACVEYLNDNLDTVAAVGRCANFWPSRYQLKANQRYPFWQSLAQNDPRDRILHHASAYQASSCYAVARAKPWTLCLQTAAAMKFSTPYAIEIQIEFMMTYMGKIKILDDLMWLRSGENHPVQFSGWDRKLEFHQWYGNKRFQEEVTAFTDVIVEAIMSYCPSFDKIKIKDDFKAAFEDYVGGCGASEGFANNVKVFCMSVLYSIAAKLPRNVKYPIKRILGLSAGQVDMQDLSAYFQQRNINVDVMGLNRVIETLKLFYARSSLS